MEYRRLGTTDLEISVLCLGTMQFGWTANEDTSDAILDAFLDAGGNFIDTANIYSAWSSDSYAGKTEEIIGRWIEARGNRENIILATKVHARMWDGPDGEGLSRAHILKAVEGSLARLKTDYIDLYQTHDTDPGIPHAETLDAMDTLVKQGKVRHVGCSNYLAKDLREALTASRNSNAVRFECLQPYYNLADNSECSPDLLTLCGEEQIAVIPYSPLAMGFLTGKYQRGAELPPSARTASVKRRFLNDRGFGILDRVTAIATARGVPPATVALGWLLNNPVITSPIIGASALSQLSEIRPAGTFRLTPDEARTLTEVAGH